MEYAPHIALAAKRLKGEAAYEVLAKAKALEAQGKKIVHLEIGQPDFRTPEPIIRAAIESLERGETGYAPTLGLQELREAIAKKESAMRGVSVDPAQVVVVPGAKTGLFLVMAATLNPGDEVIYPDPGFPAYENIATYLGAVLRPLPIVESRGFSFDRDTFASLVNEKTKLVVLNSPSNPTGGVIPADDLAFVAELAQKYDFHILSDEIYNELSFDGATVASIFDLPSVRERTLVVNGYSKTYAMPGWRLGYVIAPMAFMGVLEMLAVNLFSCTATFTQRAGVVAVSDVGDIEHMRTEYQSRRDFLVEALNAIPGVTCAVPGGAFYVFPNITSFGKTSQEIADHLLANAGVAVLPGTAFGGHGEGYLRLSYATSRVELEEAVRRIASGLASISA